MQVANQTFIQLIDFLRVRRRPKPDVYFQRFLEITDRHRQTLSTILKDYMATGR